MKKKTLLTALLALTMTTNAWAGYWVVNASSPAAWGRGVSSDLYTAKERALYECSWRTPPNMWCAVTDWYWVN